VAGQSEILKIKLNLQIISENLMVNKKIIGVSLIIAALLIVYFTYLYTTSKTENVAKERKFDINSDLAFGVTTSSYQIDGYNPVTAESQIDLLKDLGVNVVRINLERSVTSVSPFNQKYDEKTNDDFINKLYEADLEVLLAIDGEIIATADKPSVDKESEGYKIGKYAASRYKGKVKFYQISNEITGTIIKPPDPDFKGPVFDGENGIKYSTERYESALKWLRGMQRGIRESDPKSKVVLSGHWVLTDIIKKLESDGVDFDILGWAWYDTDGLDMTKRQAGDSGTIDMVQELMSFNKPVWLIEVNTDKGSWSEQGLSLGETKQANFIREFSDKVFLEEKIKGVFIYRFLDIPSVYSPQTREEDSHWGIVEPSLDNGIISYRKKEAFETFKQVIATYLNR
jgi:hypothetical protein